MGRLSKERMLKYLEFCKKKAVTLLKGEYLNEFDRKFSGYRNNCPFCHENMDEFSRCSGKECEIYHICGAMNPVIKEQEELEQDIEQFEEMIKFVKRGG